MRYNAKQLRYNRNFLVTVKHKSICTYIHKSMECMYVTNKVAHKCSMGIYVVTIRTIRSTQGRYRTLFQELKKCCIYKKLYILGVEKGNLV